MANTSLSGIGNQPPASPPSQGNANGHADLAKYAQMARRSDALAACSGQLSCTVSVQPHSSNSKA